MMSANDLVVLPSFQFFLYDAEGAGVALGFPTQRLTYRWLDRDGKENFNQPALHFGSRLPYDITVLPHPQENLTWAYNEFSMEIPYEHLFFSPINTSLPPSCCCRFARIAIRDISDTENIYQQTCGMQKQKPTADNGWHRSSCAKCWLLSEQCRL